MAETFDIAGLVQAWVRAYPGLVGRDCPLSGILLTDEPRSPGSKVMCSLKASGTSTVDIEGLGHSARVNFEVRAIGGEDGAKRQAERGCRALATAVRTLTGIPVLVTSKDGVTAKLTHAQDVMGPSDQGNPNGQSVYRLDATFNFQSA